MFMVLLFDNWVVAVLKATLQNFFHSSLQVEKTVFVVFFSGGQARTKILKICEAFGANCYPVPEDINKQRQITGEVSAGSWMLTILFFHLKMNTHHLIRIRNI